jgi:Family of unknown function (DUF5670)
MLWTIFAVLIGVWILGMVTSFTLGGFIHVLLALAFLVALIRIFSGRSPI